MPDREPKTVATVRKRNEYYVPWQDDGVWRCGGCRRKCRQCGHRFTIGERLLIECPECLEDRRCLRRSNPATKCPSHAKRHLSRRGPLHPRSGGGYLAALEKNGGTLSKRYDDAYKSIDMRTVRDEAALLQARATMLAERLTGDVCPAAWQRMAKAVQQIELILPRVQAGDKHATTVYASLLNQLFGDIRAGATESANWAEAMAVAERVAELKVRESGIERDRKAYLSATEAIGLCMVLANSVKDGFAQIQLAVNEYQERLSESRLHELAGRLAGRLAVPVDGLDASSVIEAELREWRRSVRDSLVVDSIHNARDRVAERIQGAIGK